MDFDGVPFAPVAPFVGVLNCARLCSLVGVALDGNGRDPEGEPSASRNLELGVLTRPAAFLLGVEAPFGRMLSR